MRTYAITIDYEFEDELRQYGTIRFKSTLLKGLYLIDTSYDMWFLDGLHFVKRVEENRIGSFC